MVSLKNVLLFAVSVSAAVVPEKRQAAAIQNSLTEVNNRVNTLTNAANNYSGGVSGAIPVQNAARALNQQLQSATNTVNNSPAVSQAEAQNILNYVRGTLQTSTTNAITAIINKRTQFTSAGLKNTVSNTLKETRTNVVALADALIAKAPASLKSQAQTAKNNIVAQVQRGIDAYA